MAAPFSRVLSKTDAALVAYLTAEGVSGDILPGKSSATKSAPCTIVYSSEAKEEFAFTGRYEVMTQIMIKSVAAQDVNQDEAEPKDAHDALTATVFDAIKKGELCNSETIAEAINDAAAGEVDDYTVFAVLEEGQEAGFGEDCWIETIKLKIICCCSTVE